MKYETGNNRILHAFPASHQGYAEHFEWKMEAAHHVCINV